jgi:ribulose-phosphate 3-epimerase
VAWLRHEIDSRDLNVRIEVDGGVNLTTGPRCALAGADVLVAGSFVYNDQSSPQDNVRALKSALEGIR